MKKFFACTFLIAATVLCLYYFTGGKTETVSPGVVTITEAAFRTTENEGKNVTSFVVGEFINEEDSKYSFDGSGNLTVTSKIGEQQQGTYRLVQDEDGGALMRIGLPGSNGVYGFSLTSGQGTFALKAAGGSEMNFRQAEVK